MKPKPQFKKPKKANLSLRRKLRVYLDRMFLICKLFAVILLYLIIFTQHLNSVKNRFISNIYEYTADLGFRLESVLIEGSRNLSREDIVSTLNADVGTPILSINLKAVQEALSNNDWVEHVIVARRLPNMIYITLIERVPIAIWQQNQELSLIDAEAHVIHTDKIEKFAEFLHVVGPDAHLHAATLQRDLLQDPELSQKILSAVRYSERRWDLILQQNITVKMPETNFALAFSYLSKLNKNNKLFNQNYKILDFRDASKYYLQKFPEDVLGNK